MSFVEKILRKILPVGAKTGKKVFKNMGCFLSKKDTRDFPLKLSGIPQHVPLLSYVILPTTSVKNQGTTNSCVAFSTIAAYETARILSKRDPGYETDCSESFNYYYARQKGGFEGKDVGCYLRDGLKTANNEGIALEQFWNFNISNINTEPGFIAKSTARFLKIQAYYRCDSTRQIKLALQNNLPVVVAVNVRDSLFKTDGNYKESDPHNGSSHAMMICGFDDSKNAFRIKNSWGEGWGEKGFVWYDYGTFEEDWSEAWCIEYI